MKSIDISLPIMLHFENEIPAFNEEKARLEAIGDKYGQPISVGAFPMFLANHARKPENFAKQLENQRKHRLPIRLVETGVQRHNSLSYVPGDPTYKEDVKSDLERTIKHVAQLRDLDSTQSSPLVVAPQVGVEVVEYLRKGDFSLPGFYSIDDFVERKDAIYANVKARFAELRDLASKYGLQLALENTYSAVFENSGFWQRENVACHAMHYHAFNDLQSLIDISQGNLVLDVAHFASMKNIPQRFVSNEKDPTALFASLGINSRDDFPNKAGELGDYLAHTRAFHLSDTDGIAIRLQKGSLDGRCWGDGTGKDLTSQDDYNACLDLARKKSLPISLEPEYNLKPLTFNEAHTFFEPVVKNYAQR